MTEIFTDWEKNKDFYWELVKKQFEIGEVYGNYVCLDIDEKIQFMGPTSRLEIRRKDDKLHASVIEGSKVTVCDDAALEYIFNLLGINNEHDK
jgi:hypothetical protein